MSDKTEIEILRRAINDHLVDAAEFRGYAMMYSDRVKALEGMISEKRERIAEIERENQGWKSNNITDPQRYPG